MAPDTVFAVTEVFDFSQDVQPGAPQGDVGAAILTSPYSQAKAVPGPIAGAGLPGLIAACLGLLALARRRQKMV